MATEGHDEDDVRRAVVAAVAGLEAPDRGRLAAIEQRLLADAGRRRAPRRWWWVLVGLGLAAGATAAYWGVYSGDAGPPAGGSNGAVEAQAPPTGSGGDDAPNADRPPDESANERRSPIIYQGQ